MSTHTHTQGAHPFAAAEQWETVGTYNGIPFHGLYIVSTHAVVYDIREQVDVLPAFDGKTVTVTLVDAHGVRRAYALDKLVLISFKGPAPYRSAIVIHKDRDARNCRLKNLTWLIPGERPTSSLSLPLFHRTSQSAAERLSDLRILRAMQARRLSAMGAGR